jgi:general secretion pathway protein J
VNCTRLGRRDDGFTLVELLIVLAITGMLTVLMVSGFRSVNGMWRRMTTYNETAARSDALRNFLSELLSQCYPAVVMGEDGQQTLAFSGEPSEIRFLAPLPERFGAADIVQYRLRLTADRGLVLAWRFDRAYADDASFGYWTELSVVAAPLQGKLLYFGSPGEHDAGGWQTSWHRRDALPKLIELRLSGMQEPISDAEILVAPQATAILCQNTDRLQCHV